MIEELYIDGYQLLPPSDEAGLLSLAGLGSPDIKRDVVDLPRSHGSHDYSEFYQSRVISLVGASYGASMEECHTNFNLLKSKFQLGSYRDLKFKLLGQPYEQVSVKVSSSVDMVLAGASQQIKWSVDLYSQDPRIYSFNPTTGSYEPGSAPASGVNFPVVFPLFFEGSSISYLAVYNEGSFPTPPVLTIEGPVTNPIIDNDSTAESFYTSGLSLLAGESAILDVGSRTLSVEGTVRMDFVDAALSTWFLLQPGVNNLRLRGTGTQAAQTSLSVSYYDARI